jgi:serine/threonine protein kinase/Flp pilus assembly protein TadD
MTNKMSRTIFPNTTIAQYTIISKVGEGGMGQVYLGKDAKLDRKVALKILPPEVAANQDRMRRFVQEAKAAAALNHPNIAHIYEIGEHDGTNFIAMEFVEGQTLRKKIHQERTELRKLLRFLQHTAEGLARAHKAGIVHRDLKPDNIMITRDGHAKILDFGLAKLIQQLPISDSDSSQAATAVNPQHSTPGTIIGTVGYMSPEQAQGKTKEIDQRSDIFSFGCILFEAATGQKPFDGTSVIKSLHMVVYEPAPAITELNPSAPTELQRIVRRCLAKDPDDRYQSIKDVAIELKELRHEMEGAGLDTTVSTKPLSETTSPSGPDGTSSQPSGATSTPSLSTRTSSAEYVVAGIKQHKVAAGIVVLALVVGSIGLGLFLRARSNEVAVESIAVLPFENKSNDADTEYLSDGLAESLIYRLSQLPNLKVSPTSSVMRYKGKETDLKTIAGELGVSAVLTGRITQRGDNLTISSELVDVRNNKLLWGEQYERKLSDLLATQREIAREIAEKLSPRISTGEKGLTKHYTENNEAYQLYLKGRYYWSKRTEDGMRKAIEYFRQSIDKDPTFALAYCGLADSYYLLAVQEATLGGTPPNEVWPKAKAAALKAIELDDSLAEGHVPNAVVMRYYDRDVAGAEREFKRAIELNPKYSLTYMNYGIHLMGLGRQDEALAAVTRAQELDPLSLGVNSAVSWMLYFARRYDESIEQAQKILDLDPNFALGHYRLGLAYEQKKMYQQAIAEFQKAADLSGGGPAAIAALGHAYAVSGRRSDAEKVLTQLQELTKRRYVARFYFAVVYVGLGDKDQTLTWLEKADEERNESLARVNFDPRFDGLHAEPRLQEIVRRVAPQ